MLNVSAAAQRIKAHDIVEDCPEHLNPHNAIAVGFMTEPERWQMYLRYDTTISREFYRANHRQAISHHRRYPPK